MKQLAALALLSLTMACGPGGGVLVGPGFVAGGSGEPRAVDAYCPEADSSCEARCKQILAKPIDAQQKCFRNPRVVACKGHTKRASYPPDPYCVVRVQDGTIWAWEGIGYGDGWRLCNAKELAAVDFDEAARMDCALGPSGG